MPSLDYYLLLFVFGKDISTPLSLYTDDNLRCQSNFETDIVTAYSRLAGIDMLGL